MRLALLLVIAFLADSRKPAYEDYPVKTIFKGKPAAPRLVTPGQRLFRTMIRSAAKEGPNFAGHYALGEWGCGTACVQLIVVDLESGAVYEGPFGPLPDSAFCLGANLDETGTGLFYRRDSSLLIVRGCPNSSACGTSYYSWTGAQFKLLRHDPMKRPFGCEV